MNTSKSLAAALVATILLAAKAESMELDATTLDAWNQFVQSSSTRTGSPSDTNEPFSWLDATTDRRARVQQGEVLVAPVIGRGTKPVPGGLIHDWIGAIFIPGVTLEDLRTVMDDYDSYKRIYKPTVTDSKAMSSDMDDREFSMVWKRHVMFVTAAMKANYVAHETTIDPKRGYRIVDATQIQQIESYGHRNERLLPPDTGNGYMWRIRSIVEYEERDGGVYLQIEALALTRGIPASVEWMVRPVVDRLSVDSLTTTLRQTREAVEKRSAMERTNEAAQPPTAAALAQTLVSK